MLIVCEHPHACQVPLPGIFHYHASQVPPDGIYRSPTEPISFLMVFMMHILIGGFKITDEGVEIMMVYLNEFLYLAKKPYRFPRKASTFKSSSFFGKPS